LGYLGYFWNVPIAIGIIVIFNDLNVQWRGSGNGSYQLLQQKTVSISHRGVAKGLHLLAIERDRTKLFWLDFNSGGNEMSAL